MTSVALAAVAESPGRAAASAAAAELGVAAPAGCVVVFLAQGALAELRARDASSTSAPLGVGDAVEVVMHGPCAPLAAAIAVTEKGAREAAGGGSMHGATSLYGASAAVNVDSGLTANVMAYKANMRAPAPSGDDEDDGEWDD